MKRLLLPTLRIDSSRKLSFTYRGKTLEGVDGDTVATALYANGIRVFSRSLKYHRPRGLYSLDGESANTLMSVDDVPNVLAETILLRDGMRVEPQNVSGSAEWDRLGFLDKLDAFMPAGFYYRTMHKPAAVWGPAAGAIRRMAGVGKLDSSFRAPGRYEETYLNAEVCVGGGGPAGMQAALAAARQGLRVVLLERRPWLGGFFEYRAGMQQRARRLAAELAETENVRLLCSTALIGIYNDHLVTAFQIGGGDDPFVERYFEIRAASVVVATGALERPLLFEHNERPGVMQVACAHRLARTYGLLPGKTAAFSVAHDLGLECAIDLAELGLDVSCVADVREEGHDESLLRALEERGIPLLRGWVAAEAKGRQAVDAVVLRSLSATASKKVACDVLVASAGLTPLTGPVTMAGGKLAYDAHTGSYLATELPYGMHVAGRLTGLHHPAAIEASGRRAGLFAASDCGASVEARLRESDEELRSLPGPERGSTLVMAPVQGRKTFVCFDEDTTVKNVRQAVQQGLDQPELVKRFAAVGTGPGQGGIPGHNLPLVMAQHLGEPVEAVRPTTVRAPFVAVSLAALAGSHHDMCKRTPLHESQKKPGAILRRIGTWKRVRYFSADPTCREEIENVRTHVGLLDASTLGKFRLWGPDALKALQRVYVSDMSKLKPGRVKYSAMLNDDGCVVDDGVVVKRGEDEYYLTTTTGRAGETIEWLRYHTRFDGWDFKMVNLTDAFGAINVAGPKARKVLEKVTGSDVTNEAFPFGAYREFVLAETLEVSPLEPPKGTIPVRAMRLGFVGELSFELHVPASYTQAAWEALEEAGTEHGIRNFGVEAQNILRMEKGHLIVGSETEQRTTLHDVGLGFLWSRKKGEAKTVGAVALRQTQDQPDRLKLVGFRMDDPSETPRDGAIVVDTKIRGYVSIARYSPTLGQSVGLALVDAPLAEEATPLRIYEDGCRGVLKLARVAPLPFYDPGGERMRI